MKLESRVSSTPLDMRGIFSSFPPFFKSPGAGMTDSPGSITSAIFILTNSNASATSTGEIDN